MKDKEQLHPRKFAAEQQEILEETLTEILPTIDAANFMLSLIDTNDHKAIMETAYPVIKELDQQWPFHGHSFMVQGTWYGKDITVDERSHGIEIANIKSAEAFQSAASDGFNVTTNESERPFIGLSFYAEGFSLVSSHYRCKFDSLAIADVRDVSLTYERSVYEDGQSLRRVAKKAFSYYDDLLRLYLSDDSEFYRVKHHRQKQFLDRLLGEANETLTAPAIALGAIMKGVPLAYRRESNAIDAGYIPITPRDGKTSFKVGGMVLGVTMLDKAVIDERPVTSRADFEYPDTGLCAVVDPELKVAGTRVKGQVLVPIQNIGKLQLATW